jgi:hypothetical protein
VHENRQNSRERAVHKYGMRTKKSGGARILFLGSEIVINENKIERISLPHLRLTSYDIKMNSKIHHS